MLCREKYTRTQKKNSDMYLPLNDLKINSKCDNFIKREFECEENFESHIFHYRWKSKWEEI